MASNAIKSREAETLAILSAERSRHPDIADSLDLHIALLEARAKFADGSAPAVRTDEARTRIGRGEPLLRTQDLAPDWDAVARLYKIICEIAARYRPDMADAFARLPAEAVPFESVARAYLDATHYASLRRMPLERPLQYDDLAFFALNNALHPFLAAATREGQFFVDDASWYRGYCPICGGVPDLAALEKAGGARRLLCSRCDFEWSFHRSVCPFCNEKSGQGYFSNGAYRLYTCGNCGGYLKTIDLRELAREVDLPAERVLTISMDAAVWNGRGLISP